MAFWRAGRNADAGRSFLPRPVNALPCCQRTICKISLRMSLCSPNYGGDWYGGRKIGVWNLRWCIWRIDASPWGRVEICLGWRGRCSCGPPLLPFEDHGVGQFVATSGYIGVTRNPPEPILIRCSQRLAGEVILERHAVTDIFGVIGAGARECGTTVIHKESSTDRFPAPGFFSQK